MAFFTTPLSPAGSGRAGTSSKRTGPCPGTAGRQRRIRPPLRKDRMDHRRRGEENTGMSRTFKVGDHVRWNSEAGHVSGTITRVHTSDFDYKGHRRRASEDDPQ